MSLLDDDIDDLLQAFRADEAHIDDDIRNRIWTRICDEAPDAPTTLDTLDRGARVRRLRRRTSRPRVLAVAAAVLVLVAVAGLAVRSGPNDDDITAGPPTTLPLPRDLDELADQVAARRGPVLGESDDARYTYRRAIRTTQGGPGQAPVTRVEQVWIARDGTGRRLLDDQEVAFDAPGTPRIGPFDPEVAIGLPDDADAVADAVEREPGEGTLAEASPLLLDALTYTGLPGRARAGVLRLLDRLGFVLVSVPELAPNVVRVEGTDPDGSMMQADIDLSTGEAIATTRSTGGVTIRSTSIDVDLRRDTQGS